MRLLLVATPPEDDPCQQMLVSGWACGVGHLGEDDTYGHPFLAPIAITEEDVARALVGLCRSEWDRRGPWTEYFHDRLHQDPDPHCSEDHDAAAVTILAALAQPRRPEEGT